MFIDWFIKNVAEVKNNSSELKTRNIEKSYTLNEIIQDIHNSFYEEQDKLINWGNEKLSNETKKQSLIEKAERLKKLGFINSQEVKEAELEIQRLNTIEIENNEKQHFLDAVNYFGMKYPNMKVITFDSVKKLCEKYQKYGLIYGDIKYYKGTVPDKNLAEIEKCKDIEDDWLWCLFRENSYRRSDENIEKIEIIKLYNKTLVLEEQEKNRLEREEYLTYSRESSMLIRSYSYREDVKKHPLIIIAPKNDFDLKNMEIKDFKLSGTVMVIEDPVVGIPLYYKEKQYFGILSAWGGEESTDEIDC